MKKSLIALLVIGVAAAGGDQVGAGRAVQIDHVSTSARMPGGQSNVPPQRSGSVDLANS